MSSCEKYGDWIRDAALGALAPGREREMLAHVGECDACREAYEHACELVALVDRGVESLVAGEPSPHFAARLRARIAEEPSAARSAWFTWRAAAAALALAALIAAVVLLRTPQRVIPRPTPAQTAPGALSSAKLSASRPRTRGQTPNEQPAATVVSRREFATRRVSARRASAQRDPEVLVPPGQLQMLIQFASDIRSGRIDGTQLIAAQKEMDKPLRIQPLEIKSIETTPPTSNPDLPPAQSAVDSALH